MIIFPQPRPSIISGDVRFKRKLLFHCCSIAFGFPLFMNSQFLFRFRIVLAEYFYSLLCLFGFQTPADQVCMGCEQPLHYEHAYPLAKQIPRLNNSFDVKDCCVVVWLSLKFIYSVVLVDEQVYLLSLYSLCYIYILCSSDVRIYKGDSAEIYQNVMIQCNLMSLVVTSMYVDTWGVTPSLSPTYEFK